MDYEPLLAIAIDAEGTKRRENAIAVVRRPDGWLLEVSLVDKSACQSSRLAAMRMVGQQHSVPSFFGLDEPCPAIVISTIVKADGAWFLEGVRRGVVRLTAACSPSQALAMRGRDEPQWMTLLCEMSKALGPRLRQSGKLGDPRVAFGMAMTVASAAAAEFMVRSGSPAIFTGYSKASGVWFSTSPVTHEGLGLQVYARFTAPLRRTDDRINLSCLLAASLAEPAPFTREQMQDVIDRRHSVVPTPPDVDFGSVYATVPAGDLAAMNRDEFHVVLCASAARGQWSLALQGECLFRLSDGRLEERDLMELLANDACPTPVVLRQAAVAALLGANEGESVSGAVSAILARRKMGVPFINPTETYPDGFIVRVEAAGFAENGLGPRSRLAKRDALGRLLVRLAGFSPDTIAPDWDARIAAAPSKVLLGMVDEYGDGELTFHYEAVRGGFRASASVPGWSAPFRGLGVSKADAKNNAASKALKAIFSDEASEKESLPVPSAAMCLR